MKTWADFERARKALQRYSPRFSRAELCRRAGISDDTFAKGLKASTTPRQHTGGPVRKAIAEEASRLTPDQQAQLELVIAAETAMKEAGL